jgi:hypothetical protein
MSLSTKILIWAGVILTLGVLGFIVFKQIEISNKQAAIETQIVQQKQLVDGIVRSQSEYASKSDIEKFIKDNGVNLKAVQDDLNKLHAQVNAVNVILVSSTGQHGTNVPSTGTGNSNPNPTNPSDPDPYGYQKKEQLLALHENFDQTPVPVGQVGFSAWQQNPWSVNVFPREYRVINVIGKDENERSYVYNKFSIKVNDKSYDVKIASAETKQEYPSAKFSWWNPRLFLTTGGGINLSKVDPINGSFNAGGTIGIMSYGKTKPNPDISILQVGAGYESNKNEFGVIINPVNFNIGRVVPTGGLINNIFIGPSTQITPSGSVYVGANVSVGL